MKALNFGGVYNLAGALLDIQPTANTNPPVTGMNFSTMRQLSQVMGTSTAVVGVSFTNSGT